MFRLILLIDEVKYKKIIVKIYMEQFEEFHDCIFFRKKIFETGSKY